MTYGKAKGVWKYLFWGVASALVAAFLAWSVVPTNHVEPAKAQSVAPIR